MRSLRLLSKEDYDSLVSTGDLTPDEADLYYEPGMNRKSFLNWKIDQTVQQLSKENAEISVLTIRFLDPKELKKVLRKLDKKQKGCECVLPKSDPAIVNVSNEKPHPILCTKNCRYFYLEAGPVTSGQIYNIGSTYPWRSTRVILCKRRDIDFEEELGRLIQSYIDYAGHFYKNNNLYRFDGLRYNKLYSRQDLLRQVYEKFGINCRYYEKRVSSDNSIFEEKETPFGKIKVKKGNIQSFATPTSEDVWSNEIVCE